MNTFSIKVGGFGFFWGVKHSKTDAVAVYADARSPSLFISSASHVSMGVRGLRSAMVLAVHGMSNIPEIAKTVISLNAVNVVNRVDREATSHVQPSKSMRVSDFPGYVNNQMAVSIRSTNDVANFRFSTDGKDSSENPSFWVVMKNLFKTFLGKHGITLYHKAVSKKECCRVVDKSTFQPLSLGNEPIVTFN